MPSAIPNPICNLAALSAFFLACLASASLLVLKAPKRLSPYSVELSPFTVLRSRAIIYNPCGGAIRLGSVVVGILSGSTLGLLIKLGISGSASIVCCISAGIVPCGILPA